MTGPAAPKGLQDISAIAGIDELGAAGGLTVHRARRSGGPEDLRNNPEELGVS
ncbi:hypothetical protein [Streptomyces platensis]|uniref:hypothetical protein n=1 Tax=Streptomyces platensis TaxID=58346 RepID=UPI002E13C5C7|nr:hypothetical protein OG229_12025 [Streptomyces platensis]WUB79785.1 hypothetical protein OG424_11700 [Streptomyces platensis]